MTTLREVRVGNSCTVAAVNGGGAVRRRIMDMGLTKGTRVRVRKVAPLGDPIELTVRGYELSIRKDEAAGVEVTDVTSA
jgi:ferrous iron transport protein A